jgi:D-glycero-D-manno-heptose 1,7-bisphosphate phosphatase
MNKNKAIFLDRDGVINVEKNFVLSPDEMELLPGATEAIQKINLSDYLVIVVTNQSAVARNLISLEVLHEIHHKLRKDLKDGNASVDAIYYCPHHPDFDPQKGNPEFTMECECRKPKPGMLFDAANDLNVDLRNSFLIGDSQRDIIAGKKAGCMTIGVRTGKNIENSSIKPDYIFDDILMAINYILSNQ